MPDTMDHVTSIREPDFPQRLRRRKRLRPAPLFLRTAAALAAVVALTVHPGSVRGSASPPLRPATTGGDGLRNPPSSRIGSSDANDKELEREEMYSNVDRNNIFSSAGRRKSAFVASVDDESNVADLRENGNSDDPRGGKEGEKQALYDAYNLLHTLAQDFRKPFDAPAVLVVGHQSSGKSALIEALMGFQFNQVGGGTKTRRPVALRMQYNPRCSTPNCFLRGDDGMERPASMSAVQEYIESENRRLEQDPIRCFDSREINVRMEYKYCPNMILIDTPGLIAAQGGSGRHPNNEEARALAASAREVEKLVVQKMRCQDYLILCVEDTMDWKHGSTREIVQRADPDLSRTVVVNTKLDTKVPQFGSTDDMEDFLRAQILDRLAPHKLGGPFFTSVPSGRVSKSLDDDNDGYEDGLAFATDEAFVDACKDNEESDQIVIRRRLKSSHPSAAEDLLPFVGLSYLRNFLEHRVYQCYRRNVAKIVPLLAAEREACEARLRRCEADLKALSVERLKAGADAYCDAFCASLREAIKGSILAPPSLYGESLGQEWSNCGVGSFRDVHECPLAVSQRAWDRLLVEEVGNCRHKLYGGAQYHRVLREFALATRCLRLPTITEDEVANAAGMGDVHDGVNFLHASCVIALEKARISFDPLLDGLRKRTCHVMRKLFDVSEYMLRQKQERAVAHEKAALGEHRSSKYTSHTSTSNLTPGLTDVTQNPNFKQLVHTIYNDFVQKCSLTVMDKCHDDLVALTRFVTWDIQERSGGALQRSLPEQTDIFSVYKVAVAASSLSDTSDGTAGNKNSRPSSLRSSSSRGGAGALAVRPEDTHSSQRAGPISRARDRDYSDLLQLMEEIAGGRDANRTALVVGGLVQHIVVGWRESFGKSVSTKFNCFFLLPFVDDFQAYLREELRRAHETNTIGDLFDVGEARRRLQVRRDDLLNECAANRKLQKKFESVLRMVTQGGGTESSSSSSARKPRSVGERSEARRKMMSQSSSFSSTSSLRKKKMDS
uniref:Dynamin-type G domain-containing protein n=1 Tax=Corethron hystrix TaxID=216773 RepID=A0A7S1BLX2_9STRA|mmetsp:Transcript_33643/g.77633  ORF Transcript_33643/g.77633 Transcript_33643/m.77633 type:complete len:1008 (+) Transcript_33643:327-3350(+)